MIPLEQLSQNALDQDLPLTPAFYARMHAEAERHAALRFRRRRVYVRLRILSGVAAGIVAIAGALWMRIGSAPMTSETITVGLMTLASAPDFTPPSTDLAECLLAFQEYPGWGSGTQ